MAQLPADRTKLALAQSNQVPSAVASSQRNKDAITEAYDTIDMLHGFTQTQLGLKYSKAETDALLLANKTGDHTGTWQGYTPSQVSASIVQQNLDALKADTTSRAVNVKYPPAPLVAAVGDGVADDTAAIQAAVNASNNKTLLFPAGTYRITSTIVLDSLSKVSIIGAGATITVPFAETYLNAFRVRFCQDISIHGFTLIGTKQSGSTWEQSYGVEVNRSQRVHLSNLNISNFQGDGIFIGTSAAWTEVDTTDDVTIRDCRIFNCYRNQIALISGKNITVENCDLTSTEGGYVASLDIEIHHANDALQNVRVFNSTIPWVKIDAWYKTATTAPIYEVFIDNCISERLESHNPQSVKITNCSISDLYFEGVPNLSSSIQQKCYDLFVANNRLGKAYFAHSHRVNFAHNSVSNKHVFVLEPYRGKAAVTECGIYSTVMGYAIVEGNNFIDCVGRATRRGAIVTAYPDGLVVISNNEVETTGTTMNYGLNFEGVCTKVLVHGNSVYGMTLKACELAGVTDANPVYHPRIKNNYSDDKTFNDVGASGTTAARPASHLVTGTRYFDTTLKRPIWWDGAAYADLGKFVAVPGTATSVGNPGEWSCDAGFLYTCHAANTWRRVAVATW